MYLGDMLLWSGMVLFLILLGMGAVAFVTLLERKLIGLTQMRLGPNKLSVLGILQPIIDGVKLLSKQFMQLSMLHKILLLSMPFMLMGVFMCLWTGVLPWQGLVFTLKLSSVAVFVLLGMSAYTVILTGWSSASVFSKMGSLRGMLQSISYEVALVLVIIFALLLASSLSIYGTVLISLEMVFLWSMVWVIMSLMESNRAPFDLLEGESELISGFNIEMGSLPFVYLFLSEYGMILVLSGMVEVILMDSLWLITMMVISIMLLMRSCFPRVRYDSLMSTMWQSLLPLSIIFSIISGVKP